MRDPEREGAPGSRGSGQRRRPEDRADARSVERKVDELLAHTSLEPWAGQDGGQEATGEHGGPVHLDEIALASLVSLASRLREREVERLAERRVGPSPEARHTNGHEAPSAQPMEAEARDVAALEELARGGLEAIDPSAGEPREPSAWALTETTTHAPSSANRGDGDHQPADTGQAADERRCPTCGTGVHVDLGLLNRWIPKLVTCPSCGTHGKATRNASASGSQGHEAAA